MTKTVLLGDVAEIAAGGGAPQDSSTFSKEGIPFIRAGSLPLLLNGISEEALELIPEASARKHRLRLFPADTIVFAKSGMSATKGYIYQLRRPCYVVNHLAAIITSDSLHAPYLRHLLMVYSPCKLIKDESYPSVRLSDIAKQKIPLPSLSEQRRIAEILDKADALREKRRKSIAMLDTLAQSVFLEMFGDPVTNPKGWECKPLINIARFENGDRSSNYPSGEDIKKEGILFLSTKNIINHELDLTNSAYITPVKFNSLSRGKVKQGDIIITLRGTLGSCCIFNSKHETAFINAQMMIIRPIDRIHPTYLHSTLTSKRFQELFWNIGQGVAVPQLTATQLSKLEIPVPPLSIQQKYAQMIEKILKLKHTYRLFVQQSENLFLSLQQRAFAGELFQCKAEFSHQ